jgi:hypothetical protein
MSRKNFSMNKKCNLLKFLNRHDMDLICRAHQVNIQRFFLKKKFCNLR